MDNFNLLLNELDKVKRIFFLSLSIFLLSIIFIILLNFLYRKLIKREKKVLKNIIKQLYANFIFSLELKKELNSLFKRPRRTSDENDEICGDSDRLEYKIFDFNFTNERLIFRIEPKNINSIKFFDNDKIREFIKKRISAEYIDYQFSSFTSDRTLYTLMAFKF